VAGRCLRSESRALELAFMNQVDPIGGDKLIKEIERLKAGGQMADDMMRRFSAEERALFEVMLIEALSEGAEEDREQLRSNLLRVGFDDHCARLLYRVDIPQGVRVSSILKLLNLKEGKEEEWTAPSSAKKSATESA
jgi:hypothetical protein